MPLKEFFPRTGDEVIQFFAVSFGSAVLLGLLKDPSHLFFFGFAVFFIFLCGIAFYSKYPCLAVILAIFLTSLSSSLAGLIGFSSLLLGIMTRFLYRLSSGSSK